MTMRPKGKEAGRYRRAKKSSGLQKRSGSVRLVVHRSHKHIYAQVVAPDGAVLVCASSVEPIFKQQMDKGGHVAAASLIGKMVGERALAEGVRKVAFDRRGYYYHGRVKALAESAREAGLEF